MDDKDRISKILNPMSYGMFVGSTNLGGFHERKHWEGRANPDPAVREKKMLADVRYAFKRKGLDLKDGLTKVRVDGMQTWKQRAKPAHIEAESEEEFATDEDDEEIDHDEALLDYVAASLASASHPEIDFSNDSTEEKIENGTQNRKKEKTPAKKRKRFGKQQQRQRSGKQQQRRRQPPAKRQRKR